MLKQYYHHWIIHPKMKLLIMYKNSIVKFILTFIFIVSYSLFKLSILFLSIIVIHYLMDNGLFHHSLSWYQYFFTPLFIILIQFSIVQLSFFFHSLYICMCEREREGGREIDHLMINLTLDNKKGNNRSSFCFSLFFLY